MKEQKEMMEVKKVEATKAAAEKEGDQPRTNVLDIEVEDNFDVDDI